MAKKRLSRAKSNKVIAGVFSGLANYLETEVTFLRISPFIITVLVYLFFGSEAMFGVILAILILYTGYWIALPEEDN